MREIKFRGKRLDNGEWVIGSLLQSEIDVNELNVKCQIHTRFADDFSIRAFDVDPKTVGEFTGLKDKNSKEIYDGDIVKDTLYGSCLQSEVQFIQGGFKCIYEQRAGVYEVDDRLGYGIEIIGNIYENPDLIK